MTTISLVDCLSVIRDPRQESKIEHELIDILVLCVFGVICGAEVAAFLPLQNAVFNDLDFETGEFVEFDRTKGTIEIINRSEMVIDIILFGGDHYTEPIVAQGPFVMNTQQEVSEAYLDFYSGKYGEIKN